MQCHLGMVKCSSVGRCHYFSEAHVRSGMKGKITGLQYNGCFSSFRALGVSSVLSMSTRNTNTRQVCVHSDVEDF